MTSSLHHSSSYPYPQVHQLPVEWSRSLSMREPPMPPFPAWLASISPRVRWPGFAKMVRSFQPVAFPRDRRDSWTLPVCFGRTVGHLCVSFRTSMDSLVPQEPSLSTVSNLAIAGLADGMWAIGLCLFALVDLKRLHFIARMYTDWNVGLNFAI